MNLKKGEAPLIGKIGRVGSAEWAEFVGKVVVLPSIVMQRDMGMAIQNTMKFILDILGRIGIEFRDVKHQRARNTVSFSQDHRQANAVIADSGIDVGARGGKRRHASAEGIANQADACGPSNASPRLAYGRLDVQNTRLGVEPDREPNRPLLR